MSSDTIVVAVGAFLLMAVYMHWMNCLLCTAMGIMFLKVHSSSGSVSRAMLGALLVYGAFILIIKLMADAEDKRFSKLEKEEGDGEN